MNDEKSARPDIAVSVKESGSAIDDALEYHPEDIDLMICLLYTSPSPRD